MVYNGTGNDGGTIVPDYLENVCKNWRGNNGVTIVPDYQENVCKKLKE